MNGAAPAAAFTPAWWRERALRRVRQGIAAVLPALVRRSVRRDLAGTWGVWEAPPPRGGAVLVANHHSWWDGYLAWALAQREGRPFSVLVDTDTIERYPFFSEVGAIEVTAVRRAVRRAADGAWLFVFPEGRLGPEGSLAPFAPGAAAIARLAGVPVVPVVWRVRLRGAQYPEAYVRGGAALPAGADAAAQRRSVAALLQRLDADLAAAPDPEAPLPGYDLWLPGRRSTHQRTERWRGAWGRA